MTMFDGFFVQSLMLKLINSIYYL